MPTKKPEIGNLIEHTCNLNGKFEGKVVQMLGMQFVYETEDGQTRFCLFRETWRKLDEYSKQENDKISTSKKKKKNN